MSNFMHIKYKKGFFANKEQKITILDAVGGKNCIFYYQAVGFPDEDIMSVILIANALKTNHAKRVIAVIPWLSYSLQDKHINNEPISAKAVARMLSASGIDHIVTVDHHNSDALKYFDIPATDFSFVGLFAEELNYRRDCSIVSPDLGGEERAKSLLKYVGVNLVRVDKVRNKKNLDIEKMKIIEGSIEETCVIIDDVVNSGRTIEAIAALLRKNGAKEIILCATHFLDVEGSIERVLSSVDLFITTNTIAHTLKDSNKIKVIEVLRD